MHILILGAGAMGSLLGARLSTTSANVMLFSTNRAHMEAVRKDGLTVEELDGSRSLYQIPSCAAPHEIQGKADLILVAVKTYATAQALTSVEHCRHSKTLFLTLQNGIGNHEKIAATVGKEFVLAGITAQGATLVGSGVVRHGGNGPTYLGEASGPVTPRVHALVGLFREAGFQTEASDHMEQLIWEKLLVNVGINAITALTGVQNGKIAELEPARELSREAVEEAMKVACASGFSAREDTVERVLAVARATARNRSSMGQDVDRKRRTEIEAINGAIVRLGEREGIPTPVNHTLTRLIRIIEAARM